MTYDGQMVWRPRPGRPGASRDADDTNDALVRTAVNRHQQRDKGFGPALGPDAARVVEAVFREAGFTVVSASTPWRLDARDTRLTERLVDGWVAAAAELEPALADRFGDWGARRCRQLAEGHVELRVGHRDMLALPEAGP